MKLNLGNLQKKKLNAYQYKVKGVEEDQAKIY